MAHELFGLPDRMHDIMSLALVDGALIVLLPVVLVGWIVWREHRRARLNGGQPQRRRRRRRR